MADPCCRGQTPTDWGGSEDDAPASDTTMLLAGPWSSRDGGFSKPFPVSSGPMKLKERFRRLSFWNKLGALGSVASVIGLLVSVVALVAMFWPESSPTSSSDTNRRVPVVGEDAVASRLVMRERRAVEVVDSLRGAWDTQRAVDELYGERVISPPGWHGVVADLPRRRGSEWELELIESYTGVHVEVALSDDSVSELRKRDAVRIHGGYLASASVNGFSKLDVKGGVVVSEGTINPAAYYWRAYGRVAFGSRFVLPWFLLFLVSITHLAVRWWRDRRFRKRLQRSLDSVRG